LLKILPKGGQKMRGFILIFWIFTLMMLCGFCVAENFSDDFNDGDMDGWVVVDDPDSLMSDASASTWQVQNGSIDGPAVYQGSNRWGDPTDQISLGTYLVYEGLEWTDFIFEFDTIANDNDGLGFVWRWKDRLNHYRYMMVIDTGSRGPFRRIEKRLGAKGDEFPYYEFLAKNEDSYSEGVVMHLSVEVVGQDMAVSMDGKEILSATDSDYDKGTIGFALYAEQAYFDNVQVTDLGSAVEPGGKATTNWGRIKSRISQ
jgi:hypothetical protein